MSFIAAAAASGLARQNKKIKQDGSEEWGGTGEAVVPVAGNAKAAMEQTDATTGSEDAGTKLDQIKSIVGGGGGAEQQAIGPAAKLPQKSFLQKAKMALKGGLGGLFYKMPASGTKYNNSPINKNFGDSKARGFDSPLDLKSFGVGSLKGGVSAKPRSKTGAGGKF